MVVDYFLGVTLGVVYRDKPYESFRSLVGNIPVMTDREAAKGWMAVEGNAVLRAIEFFFNYLFNFFVRVLLSMNLVVKFNIRFL